MKRLILIALFTVVLVGMQTPAFASQWIISQNGEIDVTGQSQIAFDIIYDNTDEAFSAIGWDIDLWFDINELAPATTEGSDVYYDVTYYGSYLASSKYNGVLTDDVFAVSGLSMGGPIIAAGENTLATVIFDILSPDALNGMVEADVFVEANDPLDWEGFTLPDYETIIAVKTDSTSNPDIGVVPVPAAVWLFGSGLIGLVGLRRKKN
jgi:hypothetical protein